MRRIPCGNCPWRKSTRTEDIPGGGMDHVRSKLCQGGPREEDGVTLGLTVMACHLSTDEGPYGCAGFVTQVGVDSIGVRLAMSFGLLNLDDYGTGGADLHASMDAMLAAHPEDD